jgi:hypothetical protein
MDVTAGAVTAGLLALCLGLVELVKYIISNRKNGNGKSEKKKECGLSATQEAMIKDIHTFTTEMKVEYRHQAQDIASIKAGVDTGNNRYTEMINAVNRLVERMDVIITKMVKDK